MSEHNWNYVSRNGAEGRCLDPWGHNATFHRVTSPHGLVTRDGLAKFERLYVRARHRSARLRAERQAVLLAGPPGAGKSTVRRALARRMGWAEGSYLFIDPDLFKRDLLSLDLDTDSYASFIPPSVRRLNDLGWHFTPMEVSGLWHEESLLAAQHVMTRATTEGWNLMIDGTLKNRGLAKDRLRMLLDAGYADVTVADVEVSRREASRRVRARYEHELATEPLGGRVIPYSTIHLHFSAPGGMSWSLFNSAELLGLGPERVRLLAYRQGGETDEPAIVFDSDVDGRARPYLPPREHEDDVWVPAHVQGRTSVAGHWRQAATAGRRASGPH